MNSVHMIGRLATDVEVKEVNGGSKVSSFILAVDRNAEEADFALPHTKVTGRGGPCACAALMRRSGRTGSDVVATPRRGGALPA
jgi:hypothetical protein